MKYSPDGRELAKNPRTHFVKNDKKVKVKREKRQNTNLKTISVSMQWVIPLH